MKTKARSRPPARSLKTTGTPRLSAERRKSAILEIARPIFAARGYRGTTTKELARAAGVTEPILYRHFRDKSALYSAVQAISPFGAHVSLPHLMRAPEGSARLWESIQNLIRAVLQSGREAVPQQRLATQSLLEDGLLARNSIAQAVEPLLPVVRESWVTARKKGEIEGDAVAEDFGVWIAYIIPFALGMFGMPGRGPLPLGVGEAELARKTTVFVLRGMGVREKTLRLIQAKAGALA